MSPGTKESTVAPAACERCVASSAWSRSVVRSGVSPERMSTSSAPAAAFSAHLTASPVPSACSCTAVVRPVNSSAVSGETTTTSESGSSGRAASTIQSTIRRPRIGCRCLGVAERMRVPRPPAMTTAASLGESDTVGTLAGAPGFEPGITGPKPVALPLGHAPVNRDAECTRRLGRAGRSAPVEQQDGQCNRRQNGNEDDREDADEQESERNEHDHELRDGGEPRPRSDARRGVLPTDPYVQRHGAGGCRHDEPPGENADDDEDRLDGRDAKGDLQPAAAQTARERALAMLDDDAAHASTVDTARPVASACRTGATTHVWPSERNAT